jgi:hypothetical protein
MKRIVFVILTMLGWAFIIPIHLQQTYAGAPPGATITSTGGPISRGQCTIVWYNILLYPNGRVVWQAYASATGSGDAWGIIGLQFTGGSHGTIGGFPTFWSPTLPVQPSSISSNEPNWVQYLGFNPALYSSSINHVNWNNHC